MTRYDKELDTRTKEYEQAVKPVERETNRDGDPDADTRRDQQKDDGPVEKE